MWRRDRSKELRIVDHRHYKDYCFTYMKQRDRDERNIADADLRDAENEAATFEAYTNEEEASGRNEADENKAPGAETANEYIDEVNYKQQKGAQSSDSNSNNDSAKHAGGSYDKSNANYGQSGGDGDQVNSDYGSNSSNFGDASRFGGGGNSADEWSNRDHLGAQEEDDEASTEGTDQARTAKNTENQADFDFDDLGKKSERTEKEEHVETVEESEQSVGAFCKKHKWCLLGALIGVILLALFITFLLLMLFRPQVLGMDPNNPITALNPFQSAPVAVALNQFGLANDFLLYPSDASDDYRVVRIVVFR